MELHTNPALRGPIHRDKKVLTILVIPFLIAFAALTWMAWSEMEAPLQHTWDLLKHDRIFQMVMLDFTFFFIWVFLWMIDRARKTQRNPFPWIIVGLLVATLMIYLFVLTEPRREDQPTIPSSKT